MITVETTKQGIVDRYDNAKKYGFIREIGKKTYFFHKSQIVGAKKEIEKGQKVRFELGTNEKTGQVQAIKIEKID